MNPQRHWNLLWLFGPAGVGKSAVAQTIADHCQDSARLGAAYFFSRLNNRDNPHGLIPTLAYQLAVRHSEYKNLITQFIFDDPSILDKTLRVQFRKLIVEPFAVLSAQNPLSVERPLLIIVDGLDECNDEAAQCELLALIAEHVRGGKPSPLLWMVCSRPEWHLKRAFSQSDFRVDCRREELSIHTTADKNDVYRVLKEGFEDIRKDFYWEIGGIDAKKQWPPETQLQQIARASGGLFILVCTILKFVGDKQYGDPDAQLHTCLSFLGNNHAPCLSNPLQSLDLIYLQILSGIPSHILPITKRILAFCVFYSSKPSVLCARDVANFLRLDQVTFHRALQRLHSVLDVPRSEAAHTASLKFFHASFSDFLQNPNRSRAFAIDQTRARCDIAVSCIQWYNQWIQSQCTLKSAPYILYMRCRVCNP